MTDLIKNLNTSEKKFFNEKYISKGIEIPYLENENYRYWFMTKDINKNHLKLIHDYVNNDLNLKMNKISKVIKHYTSELNSFLSLGYKASLYFTYYKYKKRLKKNLFHRILENSKYNSMEEKRFLFNSTNKELTLQQKFFNQNTAIENIVTLLSDKLGVDIIHDASDFKNNTFNLFIYENGNNKKINVTIIDDIPEHNNVSYFENSDEGDDLVGDICIYKEFSIGNVGKLDINCIMAFSHELGHALEGLLSEKYSYIERALEESSEAISLFCELITIKNMDIVIERNLTKMELENLNHNWDYDVFFESIYCIKMLNGSFTRNEFKCNSFEKIYEYHLTQTIRSSFLAMYDFRNIEGDEQSVSYSFYEFNIYLSGYLTAEKLYRDFLQ